MYKFGFELEGFYSENGEITIPPKRYPTDGFPGLCEVRTTGFSDLWNSYFELLKNFTKTPFDFETCEVVFTPEEKRVLRSRHNEKTPAEINNIYGKSPKALGNKTLASFQINFSDLARAKFTDSNGSIHYDEFNQFDFIPIIRKLDLEFAAEIKSSRRQPGWYSVKDGTRVEYRSLPNFVFETDPSSISILLNRIESCFLKD